MGLRNRLTKGTDIIQLQQVTYYYRNIITEMEDTHFDASDAFKVRLRNRPGRNTGIIRLQQVTPSVSK
jgi:hypothetical protein